MTTNMTDIERLIAAANKILKYVDQLTGDEPTSQIKSISDDLRKVVDQIPTPNYPDGRLNDEDEGELAVRFKVVNDIFVIDFNKRITWIGIGKNEAKQLIAELELFVTGA